MYAQKQTTHKTFKGGICTHIQKFKAAQIGQICAHVSRVNPDRNYSNKYIDKDRSALNYSLLAGAETGREVDRLNARLADVKMAKNRADIVKLVGITLTLPKDYKGDERAFFEAAHTALSERYGANNILYSYVHKDETTPHLHLGVVPVVRDRDERERLCAKDLFNRQELQRLHPDIQARMRELLPDRTINLLNDRTERDPSTGKPYKGVKELKQAKERQERGLQKDLDHLQKERKHVRTLVRELERHEPPRTFIFRNYKQGYERAERERLGAILDRQQAEERAHNAEQSERQTHSAAVSMACELAEKQHEINRLNRVLQDPDELRRRAAAIERQQEQERQHVRTLERSNHDETERKK